MYFESRAQAGLLLAEQLFESYRYENSAVIALSDGGVMVGEQIASRLHSVLMLLLSETIAIPGEGLDFGSVDQSGSFTFNSSMSKGEAEDYANEFHGYLEEKKRQVFQGMNRLIGDGGVISSDLIRNRNIILVSDCISDVTLIDVAINFLKSIKIEKIIIATPIATVSAVDKMHIQADELHILDVKDNFLDVNHYYDDNNIPTREEIITKINQNILNWR